MSTVSLAMLIFGKVININETAGIIYAFKTDSTLSMIENL